jgi:ubiquinone/menaquinone biosynthesis C-methylase UbiE
MSMNKNKEETIKTYNKIAPKYSSSHFTHFWVEEFAKFKSLIKGKKVIDIGCGAGRDASVFVKNEFDYTGVDASEGMLKVASERVPKGIFRQMDFYHLDFPDNTFDGFWAAASFLHVPKADVSTLIQEAKRVIKPNGVGFISIKKKTEKDEGLIEEDKYGGIARYFSFYNKEEFKNKLIEQGMEVIDIMEHEEDDEMKTVWLCYFVMKIGI